METAIVIALVLACALVTALPLAIRRWGITQFARGWEEGRLYEYKRREPKRGQGGRFAPKGGT